MPDRISLMAMEFEGHHGVGDEERASLQTLELDVELTLDLRDAGRSDDLEQTVDYSTVFDRCRAIVEERSFRLMEGIAEAVAADVLGGFARIESIVVRVRKPGVPIDGVVDHAAVEIERTRP